jgi:hypothetical protein
MVNGCVGQIACGLSHVPSSETRRSILEDRLEIFNRPHRWTLQDGVLIGLWRSILVSVDVMGDEARRHKNLGVAWHMEILDTHRDRPTSMLQLSGPTRDTTKVAAMKSCSHAGLPRVFKQIEKRTDEGFTNRPTFVGLSPCKPTHSDQSRMPYRSKVGNVNHSR